MKPIATRKNAATLAYAISMRRDLVGGALRARIALWFLGEK
jgi:hypothetical protein